VNAIVIEGRTLGRAVPDSDRTLGLRLEHDLANCVTDQFRNAPTRPRRGLAQGVELFLAEVHLGLFHICHFDIVTDIRQAWRAKGR
jgi:hypothetical protein